MSHLEYLRERMRMIAVNTRNTIGCENCGLKWENSCSAIELQGNIMEIEMQDYLENGNG